jgi:hypothetical protein
MLIDSDLVAMLSVSWWNLLVEFVLVDNRRF